MRLEFIKDGPALVINGTLRYLIVADPDALVLLGDIKHSIPSLTRQEYRELPEILRALRRRTTPIVFPGNHDIGIELFLENSELRPKDGCVIDCVGYLHGHMYPSAELAGHLIVAGHHHPVVSLKDEVGFALVALAYLRAKLDCASLVFPAAGNNMNHASVLFVPSFNEIAGYDIVKITKTPISPLSRYICCDRADVILADGTLVGPLRSLDADEGH